MLDYIDPIIAIPVAIVLSIAYWVQGRHERKARRTKALLDISVKPNTAEELREALNKNNRSVGFREVP